MIHRSRPQAFLPRVTIALTALALVVLADLRPAPAQQPKAGQPTERVPVGKCVSPTGTIVRRESPGKQWEFVKEGETIFSGDLLIGAAGAAVDSSNGAVRLNFLPDLAGINPLPIVETAVSLNATKEADLDYTLDRGRVELVNRKDKAPAKVISRINDRKGEITLEPGASCSLEVFGRWPAGMPFVKNAKSDYGPTIHVIFVVTKGEITLKLERQTLALAAPPGPALIQWDSVTGGDPAPQKLDKLPEWVGKNDKSETAQKRLAVLAEFQKVAQGKSIGAALDEFIGSDNPDKRRFAINVMGALDDLPRIGQALLTSKYADVQDQAIIALRHWIGRGPGMDQKLYEGLVSQKGWTPLDAESALQLLHSFGDTDLARPETYEMLIDYLGHQRLPIRSLANWHLTRLVPAGKKIDFDPTALPETWAKAIAEWQKLVPRGKLPPAS
jgi:hypothetical protein